MSEAELNITNLVRSGHKYELNASNETSEDAEARRVNEAAEAKFARQIRGAVVVFALLMVGVLFVGCLVMFATGNPDDKKWTAGIVGSIASGLVGYLVGQGKKP